MKMDLSELILEYRESAINHGKAINDSNLKLANKSYDNMLRALRHMQSNYPSAPLELMKLLDDSNDSVAASAATHLINFCQEKSLAVLSKIAGKNGWASFDAQMVLKEWKKGEFKGEIW